MVINIIHPRLKDVDEIIQLNEMYLLKRLTRSEQKQGFLGKLYSREELHSIISTGEIVVAKAGNAIVGYYLVGRKEDPAAEPYQRNPSLSLVQAVGYPMQVCIDTSFRGAGLFGSMLNALVKQVRSKYTDLLCSVSESNTVSQKAHERHGWKLINTFEQRKYYRLKLRE